MMEWVNPHSWLHIDVKKPDGSVERWKIEGGSPSVLMRLGWNRNSLPAGTKVTVVGFQAKDGSLRASSRDLRFPDGRRMDLGWLGIRHAKVVLRSWSFIEGPRTAGRSGDIGNTQSSDMGNTFRQGRGSLHMPEVPRCRGARCRPWSNAWNSSESITSGCSR